MFTEVLERYQSPALIEAPALDYYTAVMNTGINPALALAVFERETGCDTDPDNLLTQAAAKNWGALRVNPTGTQGRAGGTVATPAGTFRAYHSYMDGLLDWCDLIGGMYGNDTIAHALARIAPGDGHGPNSYAQTVLRRIAEWDTASGDIRAAGREHSRDLGGAVAPKWVGANARTSGSGGRGTLSSP